VRPDRRRGGIFRLVGFGVAAALVTVATVAWAGAPGTGPATDPAGAVTHIADPPRTTAPKPTEHLSVRELPRAPELVALRRSSELGPTPPQYLAGYRWPVTHARITNGYGAGHPGNELIDGQMAHEGIDISSFCGGHVVAAHDGVVLAAGRHYEGYVGWVGDLTPYRQGLDEAHAWGRLAIAVVIDDGNGYRSIYLHLNLAIVKAGDIVRAGEMLGYQGSTGASTGCHLHYALFSPLEQATIGIDPKVVARAKLPAHKIARVDPLLVLPPLGDGFISWGWGAGPS
jgi:murein DD-endopeptidase MepM/ murein hydrolase activator NlpD